MFRHRPGSGCYLLICERRDLLLFDLVVSEVLLVLLPARARCGGHGCGAGGQGRGRLVCGVARGCVEALLPERVCVVMARAGGGARAEVVVCRGPRWQVNVSQRVGARAGLAVVAPAAHEIVRALPKVRPPHQRPHDTPVLSLLVPRITQWQLRLQTAAAEMLLSRYRPCYQSLNQYTQLIQAAGQGEAPRGAERQHHCCQRYEISVCQNRAPY